MDIISILRKYLVETQIKIYLTKQFDSYKKDFNFNYDNRVINDLLKIVKEKKYNRSYKDDIYNYMQIYKYNYGDFGFLLKTSASDYIAKGISDVLYYHYEKIYFLVEKILSIHFVSINDLCNIDLTQLKPHLSQYNTIYNGTNFYYDENLMSEMTVDHIVQIVLSEYFQYIFGLYFTKFSSKKKIKCLKTILYMVPSSYINDFIDITNLDKAKEYIKTNSVYYVKHDIETYAYYLCSCIKEKAIMNINNTSVFSFKFLDFNMGMITQKLIFCFFSKEKDQILYFNNNKLLSLKNKQLRDTKFIIEKTGDLL